MKAFNCNMKSHGPHEPGGAENGPLLDGLLMDNK